MERVSRVYFVTFTSAGNLNAAQQNAKKLDLLTEVSVDSMVMQPDIKVVDLVHSVDQPITLP